MDTEAVITKLRSLVTATIYSPDLPVDDDNICSISTLPGTTSNNLRGTLQYYTLNFNVLIRGNKNDTTTRTLADSVFNDLHMVHNSTFTGGTIILINCETPIYAFRDENKRIHYSILGTAIIKGE